MKSFLMLRAKQTIVQQLHDENTRLPTRRKNVGSDKSNNADIKGLMLANHSRCHYNEQLEIAEALPLLVVTKQFGG